MTSQKYKSKDRQDRQTQSGYVGSLHTILVLHVFTTSTTGTPQDWDDWDFTEQASTLPPILDTSGSVSFDIKKPTTEDKKNKGIVGDCVQISKTNGDNEFYARTRRGNVLGLSRV